MQMVLSKTFYLLMILSFAVSVACQDSSTGGSKRELIKGEEEDPKKKRKDEDDTDDDKEPKVSKPGSSNTASFSLADGFKKYLYPELVDTCGGCHGAEREPLFLVDDTELAFENAQKNGLLKDLEDYKFNRFYQRIVDDNHNCGAKDKCEELGLQIKDALEKINTKVSTEDIPKQSQLTTDNLKISEAKEIESIPLNDSVIVVDIESGIFAGEIEKISDPLDKRLSAIANASKKQIYGSSNFEVKIAGKYRPWIRYKLPAGQSGLKYRIGFSADLPISDLPISESWAWSALNADGVDLESGSQIFHFQIAADSKLEIDKVVFSENLIASKSQSLTFNLKELTQEKVEAQIILELDIYSSEEDDSYVFKYPFLKTNKPIKVKGMTVNINGRANDRASTFSDIEKTIFPPGGYLLKGTEVLSKDKGRESDEVSINFESLEVLSEESSDNTDDTNENN